MLLLAGCATDINVVNANRYHDAGLRAEMAGDYPAAEQHYQRALINARDAGTSDASISMAMYNLGRMKGLNCKYGEARDLLVQSLQMEEKASSSDSSLVAKRLFELSRFHYDRQQYAEAASYYSRALPLGRRLGLEREDPGALAGAIDEYAAALRSSGKPQEADRAAADAQALRTASGNARPRFTFTRYTRPCPA